MSGFLTDFLIIYLIIINIIAYFAMKSEKIRARRSIYRIPESTHFIVAMIGGSIGAIIGMWRFKHKINDIKFTVGLPVVFVLQLFLWVWFSGFFQFFK